MVRAVGGGDMKIDVAVAPISCSGNFLTNHHDDSILDSTQHRSNYNLPS